jgi:hypothetical protein
MNMYISKLLGVPMCTVEGTKVLTDILFAITDVRKATNATCILVSLIYLFIS